MRISVAPNTTPRGHLIRLDPTRAQANALARACGVSRFVYNWGLAEWNRQHAAGDQPTALELKKQFNVIKREHFPWILESPRDANSQPFADLGRAFSSFFASCNAARNIEQYPRLEGNWSRETRTSTDDQAPTNFAQVELASVISEVETKP